jgi:hypothetical protein
VKAMAMSTKRDTRVLVENGVEEVVTVRSG